jgi:thiol:disulfide interchange protein DsbD
LLQADVTANDAEDRALLKRFQLFGPPGIILFDRKGQEISGSRIIGYQSPKRFAVSLAPLAPT